MGICSLLAPNSERIAGSRASGTRRTATGSRRIRGASSNWCCARLMAAPSSVWLGCPGSMIFQRGSINRLSPVSRTRGGHLRTSSAMKAANSDGEESLASAPCCRMLARTSGDFRQSSIATLSVLTTAGGVPAGATTPVQSVGLNARSGKPASTMLGTCGNALSRVGARRGKRPQLSSASTRAVSPAPPPKNA